ncbi:MAG TPA: porin [Chitinophagales bacterium]|nr:porin [Chitinophagales bacterium]
MKKLFLLSATICFAISSFAQNTPDANPPVFNPAIKFHGLIHSRFETSLTDSVDVQGKFSETPTRSNFRIRRLELRADIQLNSKWSGVIRIQFPDLKTSTPGKAIELAYFQWSPMDQFNIRGGQMKMPYELDELTSHEDLRMIDRGTTDRIFVNNNLGSYQPGLMFYGTFMKAKTPLSYYAGVFNGSDRSVPYDDNPGKNYVGRIEFSPVKSLRLAVNDQYTQQAKSVSANSFGGDISWQQKLGDKMNLIVEGEYIQGPNISLFNSSLDSAKNIDDYMMSGYFGQALLRVNIMKNWCRTFEIGGKYEHTDPWDSKSASVASAGNSINTITGGIGFIFLPDNDARLQFNMIQTNYEKEFPGSLKNNLMFVTQLQLRI